MCLKWLIYCLIRAMKTVLFSFYSCFETYLNKKEHFFSKLNVDIKAGMKNVYFIVYILNFGVEKYIKNKQNTFYVYVHNLH